MRNKGFYGYDLLTTVFLALLTLSNGLYCLISSEHGAFLPLLGVFSAQFSLYAGLIYGLKRGKRISVLLLLISALLSRAILWNFTAPILENDYWRYLWDGRVLAHGINPYLYAPLDPALDHLRVFYRHWIGWTKYGTIYPPFAEILFAVTHWIAPDSLFGLKVMLGIFDLGTGILLALWLKKKKIDPAWSVLYFLNPLVLKEISNSAHLDSVPVFFSFAAVYLFMFFPKKRIWSWVALALAVSTKLYPLVLIPLFARLDSKWKKHLAVFGGVFGGLYLPFLGAGSSLFNGTQAYAKYWLFNAGIFQVTTKCLNGLLSLFAASSADGFLKNAIANDYPAKAILGLLFILALIWKTKKLKSATELPQSTLWVLGLVLILSPVVDPWYVLWVLPFACLQRNVPWLSFSFLVVASYAWFFSQEKAWIFRLTEYLIFFALLSRDLAKDTILKDCP